MIARHAEPGCVLGALKAASRRSAVAPQRGGASLDRTCTPSPFSLWPGRRNGATTEPRNWWRGGADPTYHGRNVPITGAMAPSDLEQPQKLLSLLPCTYDNIRFLTLTEKGFLVLFSKKNTLAFFACYLFERLLSNCWKSQQLGPLVLLRLVPSLILALMGLCPRPSFSRIHQYTVPPMPRSHPRRRSRRSGGAANGLHRSAI